MSPAWQEGCFSSQGVEGRGERVPARSWLLSPRPPPHPPAPCLLHISRGVGGGRVLLSADGSLLLGLCPASSEPHDTYHGYVIATPLPKDPEHKFIHLAVCALSMVETLTLALLSTFTPFSGASSHFLVCLFVLWSPLIRRVDSKSCGCRQFWWPETHRAGTHGGGEMRWSCGYHTAKKAGWTLAQSHSWRALCLTIGGGAEYATQNNVSFA